MSEGGYRIDGNTVAGRMVDALGAETLAQALDAIAHEARLMVGAHQSAISYIPDGDFTRASHATSFSEKYEKYKTYDVMPTGAGIWGVIFEERVPMRLTAEELQAHHRFLNFSDLKDERGLEHPPMPGWLAVPVLRPNGDAIGVLQLSDRFEGEFTEEDEGLLVRLARMISAMFEVEYIRAELVAAQVALRARTRALEQSNEELEQFAFVASHDLQAPLRKVSSFTGLLQRRYGDQLDEKATQYMNFVVEGAERMSQLINDLLTFSRIGSAAGKFQPVDLEDVLAEVQKNVSAKADQVGGTVEWKKLPILRADRRQLLQLFQNLVSNGIKFHGEDPPRVRLTSERAEDGWLIRVEDNGIGIDPRHQAKVFQMFQRLHRADDYPGTGIGLAVVRKIARRHGGDVSLESTPGKGSTFTVRLADDPREG